MITDVIEVLATQYAVDVSESPVQVVDTTISHIITEVSATIEVVDTSVFASEVILSEPTSADILEIVIAQPEVSLPVSNTELVTEVFKIVSEESEVYAKKTDFVGDSVIYRGEAPPGTLGSTTGWRIRRITLAADGDVDEAWASGNASFDKIWDNRAGYTYSS